MTPGESGPLREVHLSRHKWPGGLVNCSPLTWMTSSTKKRPAPPGSIDTLQRERDVY